MDIVTKKLLNILILLAEADKYFAKVEREMIMRIAKEKNFSEEDVLNLIKNPEPIESLGALTTEQKFEYLYTLIDLIFADHNIFESELVFSKNIAIKLGFKKEVIDYFVNNYSQKTRTEIKAVVLSQFV
ncbi:MAG: TerB family tellurite resistance protein [Cyclobacteriaceae bacterium]|nr:TerB family tellurite resistance protein [Cyclobacteriaceae bacterium]